MLNLGLGVLVDQKKNDKEVDVLSYEYLDTIMMYNEACEELAIVCDQFEQVCVAYENLIAINDVIKEHGVTPALEALVGSNFPGGFTAEASMEAAEGAMGKIKEFLVKVWEAIKNFFARFFTSTFGLNARLEKRVAELKGAKEIVANPFNGIDVISNGASVDVAQVMTSISEATGAKQGDPDVAKPEFKEQKLNKESAIKYGENLVTMLKKAANAKANLSKTLDDKIAKAKAAKEDAKEEVDKLKAEAKAAKDLLIPWAKAMHTSAAGFLSHVHAGKEADKKDEPAAGEPKNDETKPAENAEAGKAGEGKTE